MKNFFKILSFGNPALVELWPFDRNFMRHHEYCMPEEIALICAANISYPTHPFVELGCNKAQLSATICHLCPNKIVIGVDWTKGRTVVGHQEREIPSDEEVAKYGLEMGSQFKFYNCNSQTFRFKRNHGYIIFIDADHSYQGVKRDFENVERQIKDDAIIFFHDYGNPEPHIGVKEYIDRELLQRYQFYHLINTWLVWTEIKA